MSEHHHNLAAILTALPVAARNALRELPGGCHDAGTLRVLRNGGLIGPFGLADLLTDLGHVASAALNPTPERTNHEQG